MRVLHATDSFLPVVGGIEAHVSALAAAQIERGQRAEVLTLVPGPPVAEGVPVTRLVAPVYGSGDVGVRRIAGLADEVAQHLVAAPGGPPDVVHVHASVVSPLAASAIRACDRLGLPTVVTVHSMWRGLGPLPWLVRHALNLHHARVVWSAVSEPTAATVVPVVAPRAVHVLGNAVDPGEWSTMPDARRTEEGPVHVVSVMRLTRVKRAVAWARVLRRVRDLVSDELEIRATIAGDGPERARLTSYLHRHGMSQWVDLPGLADREAVHRLLARADVFVAPARKESFGIAALEARAAGVPVVAPRESGVTEFVRPGVEGLLTENDEDLARQVARLCSDPVLRRRLRDHNTLTPVAHDWDLACLASMNLYVEAARLAHGVPRERVP